MNRIPSAGSARASMPFSSAIASRVLRNSMCAVPMLVMMPYFGRAISHSGAISPGWFIPISHTAAVCSGVVASTVSGTPMWLFRFPVRRGDIEFPREHGGGKILGAGLAVRAGDGHHRDVQLLAPPAGEALQREQGVGNDDDRRIRRRLPFPMLDDGDRRTALPALSRRRASPLKFSPRSAKNAEPCGSLRVSVETPPETITSPRPAASGTPRISESCWAEIGFIACRKWLGRGRAAPCSRASCRRNQWSPPQTAGSSHGPCRR